MDISKSAQLVINWLDKNKSQFIEMADQIWLTPELPWKEFKSSRMQADFLENEGFSITWNVGDLNTALWRSGGRESPSSVS